MSFDAGLWGLCPARMRARESLLPKAAAEVFPALFVHTLSRPFLLARQPTPRRNPVARLPHDTPSLPRLLVLAMINVSATPVLTLPAASFETLKELRLHLHQISPGKKLPHDFKQRKPTGCLSCLPVALPLLTPTVSFSPLSSPSYLPVPPSLPPERQPPSLPQALCDFRPLPLPTPSLVLVTRIQGPQEIMKGLGKNREEPPIALCFGKGPPPRRGSGGWRSVEVQIQSPGGRQAPLPPLCPLINSVSYELLLYHQKLK